MFCKYCGAQLDDDALFCDHCGKTVKKPDQADSSAATLEMEKTPNDMEVDEGSAEKADLNLESEGNEAEEPKTQPEIDEKVKTEEDVLQSPIRDNQTGPVISDDFAPKKSRKGAYIGIILAVVVVIVVVVTLLATGVLGSNRVTEESNLYQEMNFNNGGRFAYDESQLYFIAPYGNDASDFDDISLYSTNYNGVNKQMILNDPDVSRFRIVNDRIYYELSGDDTHSIGCVNKDGTDNTTIVSMGNYCYHYDVYKENLYYLVDSELHCCSLDGTGDVILLDGVSTFTLCGGIIYYADEDDVISSYQTKQGSSEQICKASGAKSLAVDEGMLYFSCDTGLSRVPLTENSTITKIVRDDALDSYVFYDNSIYYLRPLTADLTDDDIINLTLDLLYSIDFDEDDLDTYIDFTLDLIYAYRYIYQAPATGGTGYKADFEDSLAFCLYAYPEGIYCWSHVFSYDITPLEP